MQSAKLGKSAAVIEKDPCLGGVCLGTGTIPSKTLRGGRLFFNRLAARPDRARSAQADARPTAVQLLAKVGEVLTLDPTVAQRALEKFQRTLDTRDNAAVARALARLSAASAKDRENVMPYLVECCHAYATVGEMVACLKGQWDEFKEPVNL